MKKLFLLLITILILFSETVFTQTYERETSELYAGVGLSLVFFTQKDVWGIYPVLDVNNTSFIYEISPFLGYRINKSVSLEFAPSFVINESNSKDGFYFTRNNTRNWYVPQNVSLVIIPINLKAKYFPLAKSAAGNLFKSGFYTGLGAGITFIGESYDSYVFPDENSLSVIGIDNSEKNTWQPGAQIFAGLDLQSKLGLGFEIGYRFIPGNLDNDEPLVSTFAPNMNYIYLNIKGGLGF
jgi:hypothetical protein